MQVRIVSIVHFVQYLTFTSRLVFSKPNRVGREVKNTHYLSYSDLGGEKSFPNIAILFSKLQLSMLCSLQCGFNCYVHDDKFQTHFFWLGVCLKEMYFFKIHFTLCFG